MKNFVLVLALTLFSTTPLLAQGLQNPKGQQGTQSETPVTQEDLNRAMHNTTRKVTEQTANQVKGATTEIEDQIAKMHEEDAANQKAAQDQLNAISAGQENERRMFQQKLQKEHREEILIPVLLLSGLGLIILAGALKRRALRGQSLNVNDQRDERLIEQPQEQKFDKVDPKPSLVEAFLEKQEEAEYFLALPDENLFFTCIARRDKETGAIVVSFPDQTGGDRRLFGIEKARKAAKRLYDLKQLQPVTTN